MIKKHGWKLVAALGVVAMMSRLGYIAHPESKVESSESVSIKVDENNDAVATVHTDNRRDNNRTHHDDDPLDDIHWWEAYVDLVSVVYKPSNNTDWCQEIQRTVLPIATLQKGKPNHVRNLREDDDDNREQLLQSLRAKKKQAGMQKLQEARMQNQIGGFNYPTKTGLYLVKTVKAGSSTAAAVSMQIAETVAKYKGYDHACPHQVHHGQAYLDRKEPFFLWTIVREPAKRSVSEYFFSTVSRKHVPYNSSNLIHLLRGRRNFQLKYVGLQKGTHDTLFAPLNATKAQVVKMVAAITHSYHFIAVTERMDESLVVMKLLYGFPDEAMVVLSSKRAGGFDDGGYDGRCHTIQKARTTADVDEYISDGFRRRNYDYFLYAAVNRSLDKTIDMLGRDFVEREVKRHQELEKFAEERCYNQAVFPCHNNGARPVKASRFSCYFGDVGCGHKCVMSVLSQRNKD